MIAIKLALQQLKFPFHHSFVRHLIINTSNTLKWTRFRDMEQKMPPSRDNPIITKLDTPAFRSIFTPELNVLTSLFRKYNYELRIAGGAVRDILMGLNPKDLDFATNATPGEMKKLFDDEGIRILNTKGEKHGTITARINDKANFEITTLRIDVVTDGRHADIEFTTDWKLDANRRDLTINSMFLDFDGQVYDYFFGYDDLKKKRVTFVGDAATRIQEDYLRILRYFRFYGRIAEAPSMHEDSTIKAIKNNVEGLERVSGERIWSEWSKILEGNFGVELTLKMIECNLTNFIGLPKNPNTENFVNICTRAKSKNLILHPVTMISAMLKDSREVMNMFSRLRWSTYNRELGYFIVNYRDIEGSPHPLYPFQFLLLGSGKIKDIREYTYEVMKYRGKPELAKQFEEWIPPKFPVTGYDLKPHVSHPKLMAPTLHALKEVWLRDNCKTTADDLMKQVPEIITALEHKYEPILKKETNIKK
ncbi:hypothetical protein PV328_002428 [Microctonus aethiopoides]|uniref:Uncharacterized protein n=1 Tax=Microctonus aethiopoides TaxID=144406 RepID=A0AA39F690_9HYME|nr:hypothetical protein PV328_002428 [Microctonus aethiopoides]